MTTWRGHQCMIEGCHKRATPNVDLIPICYAHGLEIAHPYTERLIADRNWDNTLQRMFRTERFEEKRGNRIGAVVYYAQIGDYIKIGFSTRLRDRLSGLRVDELLAYEPGGPEVERARHREFAAERIDLRRENFRPSDRLETHIAAMRAKHGLPEWATRPRTSKITTRRIGEPK